MIRRSLSLVSLVFFLALATPHFGAAAQPADGLVGVATAEVSQATPTVIPEPPAPPQRPAATWNWRRRVGFGLEVDDTVLPRAGSKMEPRTDLVRTLNGGLQLNWRQGQQRVLATADAQTRHFHETSERTSAIYRGRAQWDGPVTDNLKATWNHRIDYYDDVGGADDDLITNPTTYWQYTTNGALVRDVTDWLRLSLLGAHNTQRYQVSRIRDTGYWEITPRAALVFSATDNVDIGYTYKRYEVETLDTFPTHDVQLAYNRLINHRLSAVLRAGVLHYPTEGEQTLSADLSLVRLLGRARLTASYARSGWLPRAQQEVVERDHAFLDLRTPFAEVWDVQLRATYLRDRSIGSDRLDTERRIARLTLARSFGKWLRGSGYAEYSEQDARGRSGQSVDGYRLGWRLDATW